MLKRYLPGEKNLQILWGKNQGYKISEKRINLIIYSLAKVRRLKR